MDGGEFVDTFVRDGISVVSQALISLVSTSVVVLIYVFFLLIGTSSIGSNSPTVREIDQQVRSYLVGQDGDLDLYRTCIWTDAATVWSSDGVHFRRPRLFAELHP